MAAKGTLPRHVVCVRRIGELTRHWRRDRPLSLPLPQARGKEGGEPRAAQQQRDARPRGVPHHACYSLSLPWRLPNAC